MAKVLSVVQKTSQQGKAYYIITAEGLDHQVLSFNALKLGDDIDPANLELNANGDTYKFKGGTNGKAYQGNKAAYQRNDNLIVAQVAFKAIVDLAVKDKLDLFDDKGLFRKEVITKVGIGMAQAINAIAEGSKPSTKAE